MVDLQLQDVMAGSLMPGEKIVWAAKPHAGIKFRKSDAFLIPFSLLWGGFAIFWVVTAYTMGAPIMFVAFGVPFVLVGIYLIIGRFFADALKRGNTIYALTTDRVIVRSGIRNKTTTSFNLKNINSITYTENSEGIGSITLGPSENNDKPVAGKGISLTSQPNVIEFVESVKYVYQQILSLQSKQHNNHYSG